MVNPKQPARLFSPRQTLQLLKRPRGGRNMRNSIVIPSDANTSNMSNPGFRAAILVVSTTASTNPVDEHVIPTLKRVFAKEEEAKWKVTNTKIVRDDIDEIQRVITSWTDDESPVDLIVTSGGTGFSIDDVTPEAVSPLLHKHAPGFVHGMLAESLKITPLALLSRPVAGIRNKTIIITVPGSPKGAKESLEAILKIIPHACQLACGVDSRKLHSGGVERLEEEAGLRTGSSTGLSTGVSNQQHPQGHAGSHGQPHGQPSGCSHEQPHAHSHALGHDHGHPMPVRHTDPNEHPLSNDTTLGPNRRHRSSQFPLTTVEDALTAIKTHTPAPSTTMAGLDGTLVGSVLAEDIVALEAVPAYRASIVDGYAMVAPTDGVASKGVFPVVSIVHAAPGDTIPLIPGQIARITTGAPIPPGADAVVMVEDTVLVSSTPDGKEELEVEILAEGVKPGLNIREVGSDVRKGEIILRQGDSISDTGGELGLLASVGRILVPVYKRAVVGVLSTGDEIVPHNLPGTLQDGEVRDCNRPTLLAAIHACGFEAVDLGIVRDKQEDLDMRLRDAFQLVDVVITSGGVSMGELDLLKPTIERSLGGSIHFGRVLMKPGKPTTFATVPVPNSSGGVDKKPIFSLPGNPASAIVTFYLFVLKCLHQMSGISPAGLPKIMVTLEHDFRLDPGRPEYHRAVAAVGKDGLIYATSTGGQRSSKIGSLKSANVLLCLPKGEGSLGEGKQVEALLMGKLGSKLDL